MPARTLPNLGLQSFFDLGEDGWKDENDLNMLKLSVLVQGGVSARVDALPPAPEDGQVIIFTTDQTVQVYDAGAWVAFTPMEGWLLFDRATDEYVTFDGDAWVVLETGGGGGGEYPLPDPAGMGGKIVAAKADGTGYELVDDQVGTGGDGGGTGTSGLKFRYLRIQNITNYSDGASAREIKFRKGGADLPTPTILFQNASSEYPFARAIDGLLTNFFSTYGTGINFYTILDFGQVVEMDEFIWYSRTDSYQQAPAKVELVPSLDGKLYDSPVSIYYDLPGWTVGGAARSTAIVLANGGSGANDGSTAVPLSRSWRVRAPGGSQNDQQGIGIGEIRWLDASGVNLVTADTTGVPIYSSTEATSNNFSPAKAYDGLTGAGNGWYASLTKPGSVNGWFGRLFGPAVLPRRVAIAPLATFPQTFPTQWVIEFMDGTGAWIPLAAVDTVAAQDGVFQTFDIPQVYFPAANSATPWSGKRVAVIGDSIVDYSPGGIYWTSVMADKLGIATLDRDGLGGRTMADAPARINAVVTAQTAGVIIALGTNDYGNNGGRPIGAVGDAGNANTFAGDINATIAAAVAKNPKIRIVFFAPIQRTTGTGANGQGKTLRDYVDMLIAVAAEFGTPVFDMYRRGGFNVYSAPTLLGDGIHPTAVGNTYYGTVAASEMMRV